MAEIGIYRIETSIYSTESRRNSTLTPQETSDIYKPELAKDQPSVVLYWLKISG